MKLGKIKARIDYIAKTKNKTVQEVWDMYFFENFLHRISKSEYKDNFVFKGGFLLQSMLGIEARSTMDIDLRVEKLNLVDDNLYEIFSSIAKIDMDDEISYQVIKISDIALEKKYKGKSVKISAKFYNVCKVFSVDLAIGDIVTPFPKRYIYKSGINDLEFNILSYTVETILAEKFQTLIYKGEKNSRSKDILDMHLLVNEGYDTSILNSAMINTFFQRDTPYNSGIFEKATELLNFDRFKLLYENYAKNHIFAHDISFDDCKRSINKLLSDIKMFEPLNIKDYNIDLHIVRHGQDEEDKLGGWSSNHLTDKGKEEVRNLIGDIDDHYDLFISSDLVRTKETSLILNSKLNMEIKYDPDFRETNNGDLKDLTKQEFNEKYNGLYFSSLKMDQCYPNGESPNQFYKRIKDAFIKLLEENKNKKILLVTHGGVITVIMCLIYGLPYSNLLKITPKTGTILKF